MSDTMKTNGNGEPSPKEREIAAYLADRSEKLDASVAEVMRLKTELAGYKVALEAKDAQLSEMESRMQSAYAVRDEAVYKAAKHEAINASALAVLRAGEVQNQPLVREIPEEEVPAIGGA